MNYYTVNDLPTGHYTAKDVIKATSYLKIQNKIFALDVSFKIKKNPQAYVKVTLTD